MWKTFYSVRLYRVIIQLSDAQTFKNHKKNSFLTGGGYKDMLLQRTYVIIFKLDLSMYEDTKRNIRHIIFLSLLKKKKKNLLRPHKKECRRNA